MNSAWKERERQVRLCRSPTVSECISEFSIPMRKHEQKQEFILAYGSRGIDHEDKGYMAASS